MSNKLSHAPSGTFLFGENFLDLDIMIRTHGVLNATGVLLGVAAYQSDDS